MLRRLRIYFTGFFIGLIIVAVMFMRDDSRDLDIWMPDQRILEDIRNDQAFQHSEQLACYASCLGLSEEVLAQLWTDSKTKSLRPGGAPYQYLITLITDEHQYEAIVEWDNEVRTLVEIRDKRAPKACPCHGAE